MEVTWTYTRIGTLVFGQRHTPARPGERFGRTSGQILLARCTSVEAAEAAIRLLTY